MDCLHGILICSLITTTSTYFCFIYILMLNSIMYKTVPRYRQSWRLVRIVFAHSIYWVSSPGTFMEKGIHNFLYKNTQSPRFYFILFCSIPFSEVHLFQKIPLCLINGWLQKPTFALFCKMKSRFVNQNKMFKKEVLFVWQTKTVNQSVNLVSNY